MKRILCAVLAVITLVSFCTVLSSCSTKFENSKTYALFSQIDINASFYIERETARSSDYVREIYIRNGDSFCMHVNYYNASTLEILYSDREEVIADGKVIVWDNVNKIYAYPDTEATADAQKRAEYILSQAKLCLIDLSKEWVCETGKETLSDKVKYYYEDVYEAKYKNSDDKNFVRTRYYYVGNILKVVKYYNEATNESKLYKVNSISPLAPNDAFTLDASYTEYTYSEYVDAIRHGVLSDEIKNSLTWQTVKDLNAQNGFKMKFNTTWFIRGETQEEDQKMVQYGTVSMLGDHFYVNDDYGEVYLLRNADGLYIFTANGEKNQYAYTKLPDSYISQGTSDVKDAYDFASSLRRSQLVGCTVKSETVIRDGKEYICETFTGSAQDDGVPFSQYKYYFADGELKIREAYMLGTLYETVEFLEIKREAYESDFNFPDFYVYYDMKEYEEKFGEVLIGDR